MARARIEVWHRYPSAAGVRLVDLKMFIAEAEKVGLPDGTRIHFPAGEINAVHVPVPSKISELDEEHT